MAEWQTHEAVIKSHSIAGMGASVGMTFLLTYTSSVKSHREQYKRHIWEKHCKWGYAHLALKRELFLKLGPDQKNLLDLARYTASIPTDFPDDSTALKCDEIFHNSIVPAADKMNSIELWSNVIDGDEYIVQQFIRNYSP